MDPVCHRVMNPKDADRMANSVDPDQEQSDLGYTVCSDLSFRKFRNITVNNKHTAILSL